MKKQVELIGEHPNKSDTFGKWLASEDLPSTPTKCHRKLQENPEYNLGEIINRLSDDIIKYHYPDERLKLLVKNYEKLGFDDYAEYLDKVRKTPVNLVTQKGNLTEIILCEYVCATTRKELKYVYRFRYNPNVDQSMKGDDMLLIDDDADEIRVFLGEAKYRKKPDKKAIEDIVKALTKEKQPISYTFVIDILMKDPETTELGVKLEDFVRKAIKSGGDITYVGLLLGSTGTATKAENHIMNDNPRFLFISLEIADPEMVITESFHSAHEKLLNLSYYD